MLRSMEPSASAATSAGPRVYVPFTHPDSPVPTYAVLQFLGFSSPPDSSHPSLLNPNFPPTMNPSPPQHLQQLTCSSPLAANSLPHPHPNPIPITNPSPSPSPSPSPKGSSPADSSSYSSGDRDRDEKDKKLTSIKPSPMKKPGASSSAAGSLSPGARRGVKGSMTPSISISHTDRDTIIHTHCSNFREVVHQLTGAGSGDKDLMPVTMPARTINRNGGDNQGNVRQENPNPPMAAITAPKLADLGSVRTTTTKLLERRKSNKVLERLSTSCRDLPPLVPSPVTPLASDFEKICLPVTPTTSQGSSTAAAAVTLSSHEAKAMEVGAEEGKAMDVVPSLPHAAMKRAMGMGSTNTAHDEELVIARKGFFLHSQRPRHGDPTLLHLFPESPREH